MVNRDNLVALVDLILAELRETQETTLRIPLRKQMIARDLLPVVRSRADGWFVNRDHADLVIRKKDLSALVVGSVVGQVKSSFTANEADHQPVPTLPASTSEPTIKTLNL